MTEDRVNYRGWRIKIRQQGLMIAHFAPYHPVRLRLLSPSEKMIERTWKPNVTVAALVMRDGKFLLVEEETDAGIRLNQPAGHLEQGESLLEAVIRECREETGYDFCPKYLVGIYQSPRPNSDITYLRFAFAGEVVGYDPARPLDSGIIAPHWLPPAALSAAPDKLRSRMVLACVEDYLAGKRLPLDAITHYA